MCVCVCTILHVFKTSTNLEKRNHASENFYVEELKIQSYYDVVHLCVSFCVSKFWMSVVFDWYPDDKSLLSRYLEDQYLEYMILKKNIFWINILGGGIDFEEGDLVGQLDVPSRPKNGNIANIGYLLFLMWEGGEGGGGCLIAIVNAHLKVISSLLGIPWVSYLCLGPKIIDDHMTVPEIKHKMRKRKFWL